MKIFLNKESNHGKTCKQRNIETFRGKIKSQSWISASGGGGGRGEGSNDLGGLHSFLGEERGREDGWRELRKKQLNICFLRFEIIMIIRVSVDLCCLAWNFILITCRILLWKGVRIFPSFRVVSQLFSSKQRCPYVLWFSSSMVRYRSRPKCWAGALWSSPWSSAVFQFKKKTTTSLYLDWRARGIEQDWYVCYASLTWDSVLSWLQVKKLC